jgi:hypothetical protein
VTQAPVPKDYLLSLSVGLPDKRNFRFFKVFAWCSDPKRSLDPTQRGHLKVT